MTKVKYIRVSTTDQNTSRQEVNAKEFSKIYIDKTSGSIHGAKRSIQTNIRHRKRNRV